MKHIYQYKLSFREEPQEILMPKGAKILCVRPQPNGEAHIIAEVDPRLDDEARIFEIYMTGEELPEDGLSRVYIDSYQVPLTNCLMDYHVYEYTGG